MKYNCHLDNIIELNDKQKDQLYEYYKLLNDGANTMNLTTILEEEEVYIKHFYDSMMVLKEEVLLDKVNVLDLGSGAGLPGIVLKIVYPKIKITLLEATQRKCQFLNTVVEKLGLEDVQIICDRAENFSTKKKECYDIVTARAVASLNILAELAIPFVKLNGFFIAMKGQNYQKELDDSKTAISILGGKITNTIIYNLPNNSGMRCLIKIKKLKKTPNHYPRIYAKIKNKPL